ncbi:hypothetical protein AKJ09_09289 [Labilithrix luteola]|uniref:Uncharacterized protein n=1 Tax=Labilithrix luteola TaxID=1391654 RepID=A0A0K1QA05_9BACT|nr:hypothetical protein [Labilithrix luteola]AKV02626.1 hypothetical protein AKJ09_09289 [Labilithrix luteola]
MVFNRIDIERAVVLQAKGYSFLRWLEKGLQSARLAPNELHAFGSLEQSARAWVEQHYASLPSDVQPAREDVEAFSHLFSTYLRSTFDLDPNPGKRLYSPDAHCFCPICSWLVQRSYLRPKKVQPADKRRALRMMKHFVLRVAEAQKQSLPDDEVDTIVGDPDMREPLGLCAYAVDLLERLEGRTSGAASLALWRSFAWTATGSPKQGFVLATNDILDAEQRIADRCARSSRE